VPAPSPGVSVRLQRLLTAAWKELGGFRWPLLRESGFVRFREHRLRRRQVSKGQKNTKKKLREGNSSHGLGTTGSWRTASHFGAGHGHQLLPLSCASRIATPQFDTVTPGAWSFPALDSTGGLVPDRGCFLSRPRRPKRPLRRPAVSTCSGPRDVGHRSAYLSGPCRYCAPSKRPTHHRAWPNPAAPNPSTKRGTWAWLRPPGEGWAARRASIYLDLRKPDQPPGISCSVRVARHPVVLGDIAHRTAPAAIALPRPHPESIPYEFAAVNRLLANLQRPTPQVSPWQAPSLVPALQARGARTSSQPLFFYGPPPLVADRIFEITFLACQYAEPRSRQRWAPRRARPVPISRPHQGGPIRRRRLNASHGTARAQRCAP